MRTGSQMFFQKDTTNIPIHKRPICWCYTLLAIGAIISASAFLILYLKTELENPGVYASVTAPPTDWGTYLTPSGPANCPFGGCTPSPTRATLEPTPANTNSG
jgi:hypothetical protein